MMTEEPIPFFSVIVPNYNHGPYLRQRIDSIIGQSFDDFELILLDDKSSDDSVEILMSYADNPHVSHIVINEENSGSTFRQWEKGVSLSRGKYIWIAESDDVADADFLNCAYNQIANGDGDKISLLYFKSNVIDSQGNITHRAEPEETIQIRRWKGTAYIRKMMLRENSVINASSAVFKREAMPPFSVCSKYRYCGDWIFWTMCAAHGDVVRVNEYYNYFRMHSNKVTPHALTSGLRYVEGDTFMYEIMKLAGLSWFATVKQRALFYSDMLGDIFVKSQQKREISKKMVHTTALEKTIGKFLHAIKSLRRR